MASTTSPKRTISTKWTAAHRRCSWCFEPTSVAPNFMHEIFHTRRCRTTRHPRYVVGSCFCPIEGCCAEPWFSNDEGTTAGGHAHKPHFVCACGWVGLRWASHRNWRSKQRRASGCRIVNVVRLDAIGRLIPVKRSG